MKREVISNDEGELFWINKHALLDRQLSATTKMTLKHYLKNGKEANDILVGVVNTERNRPIISWTPVQDWEGM